MISTTVLLGGNIPSHLLNREVKSDERLSQLPKFKFAGLLLSPEAPYPPELLPAS